MTDNKAICASNLQASAFTDIDLRIGVLNTEVSRLGNALERNRTGGGDHADLLAIAVKDNTRRNSNILGYIRKKNDLVAGLKSCACFRKAHEADLSEVAVYLSLNVYLGLLYLPNAVAIVCRSQDRSIFGILNLPYPMLIKDVSIIGTAGHENVILTRSVSVEHPRFAVSACSDIAEIKVAVFHDNAFILGYGASGVNETVGSLVKLKGAVLDRDRTFFFVAGDKRVNLSGCGQIDNAVTGDGKVAVVIRGEETDEHACVVFVFAADGLAVKVDCYALAFNKEVSAELAVKRADLNIRKVNVLKDNYRVIVLCFIDSLLNGTVVVVTDLSDSLDRYVSAVNVLNEVAVNSRYGASLGSLKSCACAKHVICLIYILKRGHYVIAFKYEGIDSFGFLNHCNRIILRSLEGAILKRNRLCAVVLRADTVAGHCRCRYVLEVCFAAVDDMRNVVTAGDLNVLYGNIGSAEFCIEEAPILYSTILNDDTLNTLGSNGV